MRWLSLTGALLVTTASLALPVATPHVHAQAPAATSNQVGPNMVCNNGGGGIPAAGNPPGFNPVAVSAGSGGTATAIIGGGNGQINQVPGQGSYGPTPGGYPGGPYPGYGQGWGRSSCLLAWTDRSIYYGFGQPVFACYVVPAPGYVELDLEHFSSGYGFNAYSGWDDGTGGCGFLGYTGLDTGWRAYRIRYWDNYGREYDYSSYYYVTY